MSMQRGIVLAANTLRRAAQFPGRAVVPTAVLPSGAPARVAGWRGPARAYGASVHRCRGFASAAGSHDEAGGTVIEAEFTEVTEGDAPPAAARAGAPRKKHKSSFKRASSTMLELRRDREARMAAHFEQLRGPIPDFEVGDALELRYAQEVGDEHPQAIRGTVIAKRNKGLDSGFTMINQVDDAVVTLTYPYNTPLLKDIQLHTKWRLHDGKRRARRAKLYYLKDRPAKEFAV